MPETLSRQDESIFQWLSLIEDPQNTHVSLKGQTLEIVCSDAYTADRLWQSRQILYLEAPLKLGIYVKKRIYIRTTIGVKSKYPTLSNSSTSMTANCIYQGSKWARSNSAILETIPGFVFVHSADRTNGYPYLMARPDITEARLNKPIDQLLGQPLRTVSEGIALPREAAIQEAIELQQKVQYNYDYEWNGAIWRFKCEVLPAGEDEVVVFVQDAKLWQRGYWLNRA